MMGDAISAPVGGLTDARGFPVDVVFESIGDAAQPSGVDAAAGPDLPGQNRLPREAVLPLGSLKDAPGFFVPAAIVEKRHLAISASHAAWVQVGSKGQRELVTWDLFANELPQVRSVLNLQDPRELAVSGQWLVWVDTSFDPAGDVFALHLETGQSLLAVGAPGFQRRPAIAGSVVIWEDCRACPANAPRAAAELFRRDLDGVPAEEQLTVDTTMDRFPTFGTLADGTTAIAWLRGSKTLRVLGGGVDASFEANGSGLEGIALAQGRLAFRAQPTIINPDSMIPTEPWSIEVATSAVTVLATDQTISGVLPSGVVATGGQFAWLTQNSVDSGDTSVVVTDLQVAAITAAAVAGVTELVGGGGWLGFVAPRVDNGGDPDIWFSPAP